jgi:GH24 family phage-related lysozyme (muramidase)
MKSVSTIIKEELIIFSDNLYIDHLLSNKLDESIGWGDIKGFINKISDKSKLVSKALKKFNSIKNIPFKKYLLMIIVSTLIMGSGSINKAELTPSEKTTAEKIADNNVEKDQISYEELMSQVREAMINMKNNIVDGLSLSKEGLDLIISHEGFKDTAYKLGDGKITIGYGHAEPVNTSKYKEGDKISREEASQLLRQDVKTAEDGVKRILKKIISENSSIEITQSMFDAMVSMAYNMGVTGLYTTEFVNAMKNNSDLKEIAEYIKDARVGDWAGLKDRRADEYKMFLSDLGKRTNKKGLDS